MSVSTTGESLPCLSCSSSKLCLFSVWSLSAALWPWCAVCITMTVLTVGSYIVTSFSLSTVPQHLWIQWAFPVDTYIVIFFPSLHSSPMPLNSTSISWSPSWTTCTAACLAPSSSTARCRLPKRWAGRSDTHLNTHLAPSWLWLALSSCYSRCTL